MRGGALFLFFVVVTLLQGTQYFRFFELISLVTARASTLQARVNKRFN